MRIVEEIGDLKVTPRKALTLVRVVFVDDSKPRGSHNFP